MTIILKKTFALFVLFLLSVSLSWVIAGPTTLFAKEGGEENPVIPEAQKMVLEVIVPTKQVSDTRVLQAVMRVPRDRFVLKEYRPFAYQDFAIPIGEEQTISPPFVVTYMTEKLEPQPTDRVLEIGTGSGYQAAVLSSLVADVYTIEIVRPLGKKAEALLKKLKYDNVHCKVGDGYLGWPEAAPFDKIIVTCSPEAIPKPLVDQLKEGGKILIPLGDRYHQYFYLCTKRGDEMTREVLMPAFFVPMTGEAEALRKVLPDPENPSLIGGDFEQVNEKDNTPAGWYYTRNVTVKKDATAPQGERVLVIENASVAQEHRQKDREVSQQDERQWRNITHEVNQRTEELTARLLQPFPIDGRKIQKLDLSCFLRGVDLQPKGERRTTPILTLTFFAEGRETLGEQIVIALPQGSFEWQKFDRREIPVPIKAKEGSICLGILDGIGHLEVDNLILEKSSGKRK